MIFLQLFLSFFKVGLFAFGGGYTIIALADTEFVKRRRWLSVAEFSDFFALAQTFPGIISVNFAALLGNRMKGFWGGVVAVLGMILPAILAILILSGLIHEANNYPWLIHAMKGVRIAIAVMIMTVVSRLAKETLKSLTGILIAVLTFLFLLLGGSPVIPLIWAGIFGGLYYRKKGRIFK